MKQGIRINDMESLEKVIQEKDNYQCVILGHESCPIFYREMSLDKLIEKANEEGFEIKVNIPVVFENYLEYFKNEVSRLLITYPYVKLILNDWGMLYYLHTHFKDIKLGAGLGISFSYADCPWNYHIVSEEKEQYQEMLQTHNFDSHGMLEILKENNVDEIIISDLKVLKNAYKAIKEHGIRVIINQNVNIVTISRACHILRNIGKNEEKGKGCSKYCSQRTTIKTTHYYDMALTVYNQISEDTANLQPEMYFYSNILFSKNNQEIVNDNYDECYMLINDSRC